MLESLSGVASTYGRPNAAPPLTESQKSAVKGILAEFGSETVSKEDALAIRDAFRAEGIRPSAELKSVIEAEGFDASAIKPPGGRHGAGGPPPPPPPEEDNAVATLLKILEDYESETLDAAALKDIQGKFQEAGFTKRDSFLELSV